MDATLTAVTKTYPDGVTALDRLDLHIAPGMFGLLGPRGAGKTTLAQILAGNLQPTSGLVRIGELDPTNRLSRAEVKRRVGYLPREFAPYADLSPRQYLDYTRMLQRVDRPRQRQARVDEVLGVVGLDALADRAIHSCPNETKRRVGLARAILHDPMLLVVDEPVAGLDPEEQEGFRKLLASLGQGRTVVLFSDLIEDVATTCRQCAVMIGGRIVFRGESGDLVSGTAGAVWSMGPAGPSGHHGR